MKVENQVVRKNVILLTSYLFALVIGFMNGIQEVTGSIPVSSTKLTIK